MTDLPEGWVPLSHFDSKDRGRTDGHSPEYKQLVAAVKDGELRGLQDPKSRRYYVPQDEANRLLTARAVKVADKPSGTACELAMADSLDDVVAALLEIQKSLDRLATAAEVISTHPKKDEFAEFTNN